MPESPHATPGVPRSPTALPVGVTSLRATVLDAAVISFPLLVAATMLVATATRINRWAFWTTVSVGLAWFLSRGLDAAVSREGGRRAIAAGLGGACLAIPVAAPFLTRSMELAIPMVAVTVAVTGIAIALGRCRWCDERPIAALVRGLIVPYAAGFIGMFFGTRLW